MFKRGKAEPQKPGKVVTLIGPETHFNGTVKAKGLMRIDGVMEGELEVEGDVIIGENGRATLEIRAGNVTVAGYLEGGLDLAGKLEIRSTGIVTGNIRAHGLVIDEGAHFTGNCEMLDRELEAVPPVIPADTDKEK